MIAPRWRKLARDVWLARTRTTAMVLAIAGSVTLVTAFLSAQAVLQREVQAAYLAGRPASATVRLPEGVDEAALRTALAQPGVTAAAAGGTVGARIRVGSGPWRPLLMFAGRSDDPGRIGVARVEAGEWPPASDGLFLERTALSFLQVGVGDRVQVRSAAGRATTMTVTGSVYDPGVAPASQEQTAYARITEAALDRLGATNAMTQLKLAIGDDRGASGDVAAITRTAERVAAALIADGHPVEDVDVPPPLRHPHQGQMTTVAVTLLSFGLIALLLSSVLVATMLGGMLAGQVRQIAAMKAIGARDRQVFGIYLSLTAAIATAATAIGLPSGLLLGNALVGQASTLFNLDLADRGVPGRVVLTALVAGLVVPMLVCLPPLVRATRRTVRAALDDHGADPAGRLGRTAERLVRVRWLGRDVAMAVRSMARNPARLALTVGLLAMAGTTFLAGLNTAAGWDSLVRQGVEHRRYDLELRVDPGSSAERLLLTARQVPGVVSAQAWGRVEATPARSGGLEVGHGYPDQGHGTFVLVSPPAGTPWELPVLAGRGLTPGDTDAVVLNRAAMTGDLAAVRVGDRIRLAVEGRSSGWNVVGLVSDFGSQGTGYVSEAGYTEATGARGAAGMLRVVTDGHTPGDRRAVLDRLVARLDADGPAPRQALTTDDLKQALDGHVFVLVEALIAIAVLIGLVGLSGLGSAMTTSVTERTREFAVMQTVGATPRAVRRIVATEGLLIAVVALLLASVVALPATAVLAHYLGGLAFRQPLPVAYAVPPALMWWAVTLAGAALATTGAARAASRLTIRDALGAI